MTPEILFFNLPYPFRTRFMEVLPGQTHIKFVQVSSLTLKESLNIRQICPKSRQLPYSRLFISNNQSINFEVQSYFIIFYFGYNNYNTFKLCSIDELVLKLDKAVLNDAIQAYRNLNFTKLTVALMEEDDYSIILDTILFYPKCHHLTVYGYIPAEYLFNVSNQLLHYESIIIKNLNPRFPIYDLKELQTFFTLYFSSLKKPVTFEIIQIIPNENVINVLELADERFILHSYVQPKTDIPFLFYE